MKNGSISDEPPTPGFLSGGGELGELIRQFDWSATPLGTPQAWPQNLRMALRIMLASRQPIWIGWGSELIYFYNDPYKSIIGGKHPWALGRPTREVWREIWGDISPLLDTAMSGDQGTYVEAKLLIMERHGYPEETYYTFSYSPIPNEDGSAGGIICANSDDTPRVIGERQLGLLRDLAASATHARSWQEACDRCAKALTTNTYDLPFAMIYMAEADGLSLKRTGVSGIKLDHPAAPETISAVDELSWPIGEALRSKILTLVPDLRAAISSDLPAGPWSQAPQKAAIVPILPTGETGRAAGVLVVGLNPFRRFDENYRSFLSLIAGQIGAAIANAQAYEEERRRAEALAEIDRAKTTFFSNVSHEFRTPLTLMLGPLEDALNETSPTELPGDQRLRIETAHRNGLRLLKLVNSLLDFSRIEAGRVDAAFQPTDLAQYTSELASNFESATRKAGLAFKVVCQPLPQPVYVDRDMWEKIVLNLLSNAFKFTFEGEIGVEVRVAPDGAGAEIVVRDTGVGIPEHEVTQLFERFHRVEGQRSRSFEGSGIGLALVKELVRLHGGSISAASKVGRGTCFTLCLPFGTAHLPADHIGEDFSQTANSFRAEAYVEEALRWLPDTEVIPDVRLVDRMDDSPAFSFDPAEGKLRVLVADDNADMRTYVSRLLGAYWHVETAVDGLAALKAIRARKPDLLLSDVMMPRMDGFDLLRELRADVKLRDLPVILLSARAGEEARVEGLDASADDYLTKPFSARELIARVNANLEMARLRREATRDLRESEARFRNMADHAPVMMWVTNPDAALTYLNRGWCEFTGQTLEEALGQGAWDAVHPDDRSTSEYMFRAANEAQLAFRAEYRLRRADGSFRWVLSAAAPRFSDDGTFLGYIGSVIDLTDRKEAEQILRASNELLEARVAAAIAERADVEAQLRQAQKMDAIGKLTGGVAHDFNNVLQIIGGNLQLLIRDTAGHAQAERRVQTAIAAVARGAKLASQLLAFGRRQPLAPKVINLGRLIRGIDDMLRRALGEGIEIETIISGGLWNTFVDAAQVENALLNLAINARDAMNRHGKLTIEAGNAYLDDAYAARHADVSAGQYVMIAVTDTGSGMSAEIMERVFEPFFTTKPEGQGTGLGLSMVYGFVKQSGGHIKFYSEPGHGTTVRLYLPAVRAQEDREIEIESGPVMGGTETVLVVEDEEDVRNTVIDLLSDLGYRVLKAKEAQSALAIIESGVPIDLLFTDVVMPGPLPSPDLARKARERLPQLAVLFTSGYTDNAIVHGGKLDEGTELLSKPYSREDLARKIRHVLRNQQQRNLAPTPPKLLPAAKDRNKESARANSLRVLLVEDDSTIRCATADMLVNLGHSIAETAHANEALGLLGHYAFDVLLTDVVLPGLSGIDLAARAVGLQANLRIIFATGYELSVLLAGSARFEKATVLKKPYDKMQLVQALNRAMASTAPAKS